MRSGLFHFTSVRHDNDNKLFLHTPAGILCCLLFTLWSHTADSFSKRKPLFSLAALSCCCLDFWSDSPNVITAARVCVLSDVISASVSVLLQIVCMFCGYLRVCQLLMDLWAFQLCIRWTCELWLSLALIQPLMTAVWVDLWFIQTRNVSSRSHDSPPSPPPLATGNGVLFASSRNFPYVSRFLPRTLLF